MNMNIIETWWRHLGTFGRQNATPLVFVSTHEGATDYLRRTDDWWFDLTDEEKQEVYNDFFNET